VEDRASAAAERLLVCAGLGSRAQPTPVLTREAQYSYAQKLAGGVDYLALR